MKRRDVVKRDMVKRGFVFLTQYHVTHHQKYVAFTPGGGE